MLVMYKCKECGKEFPVLAWLEIPFSLPLPLPVDGQTNPLAKRKIRKPICPFCHQLEIEEVAVKTTT